jgi:hypothetical protein
MSFSQKPLHATSDSATATACSVSSVHSPFFRECRPPGSISVTHAAGWGDPSKGAPNASPIASATSDPAGRTSADINLTNKVYLSHKKKDQFGEGDSVQKEELLHLHMLMIHIKKYYEGITNDEIRTVRYNSLEISPVHIHKDKKAHKDALLTLGDEIVSHIHGQALPVVTYSSDSVSTKVAAEH